MKLFILMFFFVNMSFANQKDKIIKDFSSLSQKEKKDALSVMLDSVEHDMFGFYVNKNKDSIKKYGGLPGYYISHYPVYVSASLVLPVLRVYDSENKLIKTLVGGATKKNNVFYNIGGFSKPFDFRDIKIDTSLVDSTEEKIRSEIMNKKSENITSNQKNYSPEFIKTLKDEDFIDINKTQNITKGIGYDASCVDTAIRETKEETGIELNPDSLILLQIGTEVRNQKTKRDYEIKTNINGVCYFMFEAGNIKLKKDGTIESVDLNKNNILNTDEIYKNINLKTLTIKGYDDAENGIIFLYKDSVNKIVDKKNDKAYSYNGKIFNNTEVKFNLYIGNAISLVPDNIEYKTSNALDLISYANIIPYKNDIESLEEITHIRIKTLFNR